MTKKNLIKYFLLVTSVLFVTIIIVSQILGHATSYYNQSVKGTYSGVIGSALGIIFSILIFKSQKYPYNKKIIIAISATYLVLSLITMYFLFSIELYLGASSTIIWMLISLVAIFRTKIQQFTSRDIKKDQDEGSLISNENQICNDQNLLLQNEKQSQGKKYQQRKCWFYFHACCSIFTMLLITLFTFVAGFYYLNWVQYPAYGSIFTIDIDNDSQKYMIHAYCVGEQQKTRPTIVLEHGGGSNSIAFAQLGIQLSKRNWKVCSYDRLGYGRSSNMPHSVTVQKRAEITHKTITRLLQNDIKKQIIIGGWSAGVQIAQTYRKIYPTNVQGMLFLDGYPDYITLMAIYDNKTQVVQPNTIAILQLARIVEPLGLGFIVGNSQIQNKTINQFYKAFYQTGYFWQSQYFDVSNPYSSTSWLTNMAANDTKPYPNSPISLNWPNIDVPLLVMVANQTVSGDSYSQVYMRQAQKYLDKCTNAKKDLIIMKGAHDFVLNSPSQVADQFDKFFSPIF